MTSIITEIPSTITTAQLPDIIEFYVSEDSADVYVMNGVTPIFEITLFAHDGKLTFYDLRSIVEEYMRSSLNPVMRCSLWINEEGAEGTYSMDDVIIVHSDFAIGNIDSFLAKHFLTTRSSFRIYRGGSQTLSWLPMENEQPSAYTDAVSLDADGNAIVTRVPEDAETTEFPSVAQKVIDVQEIQAQVPGKLVSFTVHRGSRSMTFYVTDETPDIIFTFRNAFNCIEAAEIFAATTRKQKVERSEAHIMRETMFYDQEAQTSFEVETTALPYEEAVWLNQLFASHAVTKDERAILITSSESEISDADNATNRHKFTYRFARDVQTINPPAATQVFSEEYQSPFQ